MAVGVMVEAALVAVAPAVEVTGAEVMVEAAPVAVETEVVAAAASEAAKSCCDKRTTHGVESPFSSA